MHYRTTTPVPDRLADDLAKNRITIRYQGKEGYQETIAFEDTHLEFVPRIVGRDHRGRWVPVPLEDVRSIEIDHELPARNDPDGWHDPEEPQRLVFARWHRVNYGEYGELLRFIPQGNA